MLQKCPDTVVLEEHEEEGLVDMLVLDEPEGLMDMGKVAALIMLLHNPKISFIRSI